MLAELKAGAAEKLEDGGLTQARSVVLEQQRWRGGIEPKTADAVDSADTGQGRGDGCGRRQSEAEMQFDRSHSRMIASNSGQNG